VDRCRLAIAGLPTGDTGRVRRKLSARVFHVQAKRTRTSPCTSGSLAAANPCRCRISAARSRRAGHRLDRPWLGAPAGAAAGLVSGERWRARARLVIVAIGPPEPSSAKTTI